MGVRACILCMRAGEEPDLQHLQQERSCHISHPSPVSLASQVSPEFQQRLIQLTEESSCFLAALAATPAEDP